MSNKTFIPKSFITVMASNRDVKALLDSPHLSVRSFEVYRDLMVAFSSSMESQGWSAEEKEPGIITLTHEAPDTPQITFTVPLMEIK